MARQHNYFVYMITNPSKKVQYTGMTNNLPQRLTEHYLNKGKPMTFAGRYYCYRLVWWEHYQNVDEAIKREKQIKGWARKKKEALIEAENTKWKILNRNIMDWPPKQGSSR